MATALSLITFMNLAGARDTATIAVARSSGEIAPFDVELAITPHAQSEGLMHRTHLPSGQGMLFVYDQPTRRTFWMKNTLIPLDMLFFDKQGKLVFIYANAKPRSLAPIGPDRRDICMVLEIAGGEAEKHGLALGDKIMLDFSSICLQ